LSNLLPRFIFPAGPRRFFPLAGLQATRASSFHFFSSRLQPYPDRPAFLSFASSKTSSFSLQFGFVLLVSYLLSASGIPASRDSSSSSCALENGANAFKRCRPRFPCCSPVRATCSPLSPFPLPTPRLPFFVTRWAIMFSRPVFFPFPRPQQKAFPLPLLTSFRRRLLGLPPPAARPPRLFSFFRPGCRSLTNPF